MLHDFINLTQGQLLGKYWWLWLAILVGAFVIYPIVALLDNKDFEPVEHYYKLPSGMYFKVRITQPGQTKQTALKEVCGLLGVPPSVPIEVGQAEYASRAGATIARAKL